MNMLGFEYFEDYGVAISALYPDDTKTLVKFKKKTTDALHTLFL